MEDTHTMLNTEEAYKTVIDILLTYTDNQKLELFHYIAKNHPDAIADAAIEQTVQGTKVDPEILDALRNNKKINAIKIYRQKSGLGLKESKEYIDELAIILKSRGVI